jgi:3-deoxy-D-manno-octulosonate 8-phosphate phosphatase (KDO 8-P phosphatase)
MSSISYDLKKIKAIALDVDGVLSTAMLTISADGEPLRMLNVKDGYALQLAVKRGYRIAVISGGSSEGVKSHLKVLGVSDVFLRSGDKLPVLTKWMEENSLQPEEVAYMGDDIPDMQALQYVGLPCCPSDAAWEVKEASLWISRYQGGYGCVRDLVEQVLRANGDWMRDDAHVW